MMQGTNYYRVSNFNAEQDSFMTQEKCKKRWNILFFSAAVANNAGGFLRWKRKNKLNWLSMQADRYTIN